MHDGNPPCDPPNENPARSRFVNRAREPLTRAVRGIARWCRRNRHRTLPERRGALSRTLRGRCACYGLSGTARRSSSSSPPPNPMLPSRRSGWLNHVTVAAFILLSADAAAYHDHHWCFGGSKFVDMTDCVVWGDRDKFNYSARNTCNRYMYLTVCWTSDSVPGSDMVHEINYRCDKSHPIPPAAYAGLKPGESGAIPKGEFVWWAWRCEE